MEPDPLSANATGANPTTAATARRTRGFFICFFLSGAFPFRPRAAPARWLPHRTFGCVGRGWLREARGGAGRLCYPPGPCLSVIRPLLSTPWRASSVPRPGHTPHFLPETCFVDAGHNFLNAPRSGARVRFQDTRPRGIQGVGELMSLIRRRFGFANRRSRASGLILGHLNAARGRGAPTAETAGARECPVSARPAGPGPGPAVRSPSAATTSIRSGGKPSPCRDSGRIPSLAHPRSGLRIQNTLVAQALPISSDGGTKLASAS